MPSSLDQLRLTVRISLSYYQLRMNAQRAASRPEAAPTEKAARRLWPQLKNQNGMDPLHTHVIAAAVAAATGRAKLLKDVVGSAKEAGLQRTPVEESLLQVYLFAGYPRAIEALAVLNSIWPRTQSAEQVPQAKWAEFGEQLCRRVYGRNFEKLNENIGEAHPDLRAWMVSEGYGKVLSRPGLDTVSRELCTVGALTAIQAPRQLQAHILGARNVGASGPQIRHAIELGALGCGIRAWKNAHTLFVTVMGSD